MQDIHFSQQYSARKPSPVPDEFIDVADILMNENGWLMPDNCRDALKFSFCNQLIIQSDIDNLIIV